MLEKERWAAGLNLQDVCSNLTYLTRFVAIS